MSFDPPRRQQGGYSQATWSSTGALSSPQSSVEYMQEVLALQLPLDSYVIPSKFCDVYLGAKFQATSQANC
jgi:hypothetical protein